MMQYGDPQQFPAAQAYAKPKKRIGRFALFALSAAFAFAVAAGASVPLLLYFDKQYALAQSSIQLGDLDATQKSLKNVPAFYKDTRLLMAYAQAREDIVLEKFFDAKALLATLGDYRDSAALRDQVKDAEAYSTAQYYYHMKDYKDAKSAFESLNGYKDSDKYLELIEAHGMLFFDANSDYKGMKDLYYDLTNMGFLEDSAALLNSDAFILFRLEGTWISTDGGTTLVFSYRSNENYWYCNNQKIDWADADIRDMCLYGKADSGWVKLLVFQPDEMGMDMLVTDVPGVIGDRTPGKVYSYWHD